MNGEIAPLWEIGISGRLLHDGADDRDLEV